MMGQVVGRANRFLDRIERKLFGSQFPMQSYMCIHILSFLDGASSPEELVREAARLELEALH